MRISDWSSDVCSSDLVAEKVLQDLDHEFHRRVIVIDDDDLAHRRARESGLGFFQRQALSRIATFDVVAHAASLPSSPHFGDTPGQLKPIFRTFNTDRLSATAKPLFLLTRYSYSALPPLSRRPF